jgi:hypothetical protein
MHTGFGRENLKESDNLGDLRLDGTVFITWILKKICLRWDMDWIYSAQDREKWQAVV